MTNLFDNLDNEWKQFVPHFEYIYNDLGSLNDDALEMLNNKFLAASFLALKHSFEKEWLERNGVQLLILAGQGPENLQKGFIVYLYSRGRLEENILKSLPESIKKTIMNTLDIYIEKGRKEGSKKALKKVEKKVLKKVLKKVKGNL